MARRLTIVVELNDPDQDGPLPSDPVDAATDILDGLPRRAIVSAEWGETLRGNALQIGDGGTQVNNFGPD